MMAANSAFLDEQYEQAISYAKEVCRISPGVHDPLHLLGLIYETAYNDYAKALNYYFIAAKFLKTDVNLWKHVGQIAQNLKDYDLAVYCYRRVVHPSKSVEFDEEVAYELACIYVKRLDFPRAQLYFSKLLSRHPGDAYLGRELAKCEYKLNHYDRAISVLESCVGESRTGVDWDLIAMLCGLQLQEGHADKCFEVLTRLCAGDDPLKILPANVLSRYAAAKISLAHKDADDFVDSVLDTLKCDQITREESVKLHMGMADAYLRAHSPRRALLIYKIVECEQSRSQKSEFWIRIAKCHIQLRQYDEAATFLEAVIPCEKQNYQNESISIKVRDAEASLLLFQIVANLDANSEITCQLDSVAEAAVAATALDNRLNLLKIGMSMGTPTMISTADRNLILFRLSSVLAGITAAISELRCMCCAESWMVSRFGEALPEPVIELEIAEKLLPPVLLKLHNSKLNIMTICGTLSTSSVMTRRSYDQGYGSPKTKSSSVPNISCGSLSCKKMLDTFIRLWRCFWLVDFILVVRDSFFDMPRILNEASRIRAQTLAVELAKEQGFLDENHKTFEAPLNGLDLLEEEIEARFILRTRPLGFTKELLRRKWQMNRGFKHRILQHSKLKDSMGITSLEDLLGWKDFYSLLEHGCRMLIQENMGRLACELLESALLVSRFSRSTCITEFYGEERTAFRTHVRSLATRISIGCGLMRLALSSVRRRYILPKLIQNQSLRKIDGFSKSDGKGITVIIDHCMSVFNSFLFVESIGGCPLKSIASSRDKDLMSFNRAWCTRHLAENPLNYGLNMVTAHFSLLSTRWPYAISQYTRAVHMRPNDPIASLCLATSTLGLATSRGVQDRHHAVIRGLAMLKRFQKLRKQQKQFSDRNFVEFAVAKFGRFSRGHKVEPAKKESYMEIIRDIRRVLEIYFDSEENYNLARAFHHLDLGYLAMPLYSEVIDRLTEVKDLMTTKYPEWDELAHLLILARKYSPAATCTTQQFAKSNFPMNSSSSIIKHFGLNIILSQLDHEAEDAATNENWQTEIDSWILPPPLRSTKDSGQQPMRSTKDSGQEPMRGLFCASKENESRVEELEIKAQNKLNLYFHNLPPGFFLPTIEAEQLRISAVQNVSCAYMQGQLKDQARAVRNQNISW